MTDEINKISNITVNKNNVTNQGMSVNKRFNQIGEGYQGGTIEITSGATVELPIDQLTTPGMYQLQFISGDSGATVQVGPDNGGTILPMDEIYVGEVSDGRVSSGVTIKIKAVGGDVTVETFVAEA